jgi:hypothetical protein
MPPDPPEQTLYLSTAAAMAAVAFEAYMEPTVGKAGNSRSTAVSVVNGSVGGTTVQYMDNTTIQELFDSAMLVNIRSLSQTPSSRSVRSSYYFIWNHISAVDITLDGLKNMWT